MQQLDWIVLSCTLLFIVLYGAWKTRGSKNVEEFIKGGSDAKWWTIGLSVMATQASAITFLSTTGQAFDSGMGFVQFYFGLPIAMVVICMVFIPIYHRLKVFTAYEYLESRFDLKTRTLTAVLFLIQRGLAAGITIFAPAIILSVVLGWDLITLNIIIGLLVIIYTVSGGTKAVSVTQKQQMAVIFAGMFAVFFIALNKLPDEISFVNALDIAGANNRMNVLDFSFDLDNRYTFWSGIIGGSFLALSYFGTDQSQVQRYLSGKSVKEMRWGMMFNGLLKVPMQFFILLVGIIVFIFYQFNIAPLNFNSVSTQEVLNSKYKNQYEDLQAKHKKLFEDKKVLSLAYSKNKDDNTKLQISKLDSIDKTYRSESKFLIKKAVDANYEKKYNSLLNEVNGLDKNSELYKVKQKELKTLYKESAKDRKTNDRDYMFLSFILKYLPNGLIGLLLAVILSAAMSSTASEVNALATITSIDLFKRNQKQQHSDIYYVKVTKLFTVAWGVIAIIIACFANLAENLIQLVNIIGSIFYGNVLGIFLLAFFVKFVRSNAVFVAALITQVIVIIGWYNDWMPYLWLNLFGCVLVMMLAIIIQSVSPQKTAKITA